MSELRLHLILTSVLLVAGTVVLHMTPEPRYLDDPRWLWLFSAVALFGAGLGVIAAMFASAIGAAIRIHHAERAAKAAAAAPLRHLPPLDGARRATEKKPAP